MVYFPIMKIEQFNKLVKPDKYQVFLFSSPCSLPISFSKHTWLVTNNQGSIHRYEIWSYKERETEEEGHLTVDFYPPTTGLTIFPGQSPKINRPRFDSQLIDYIEGENGSLAHRLCIDIENNYSKYPYIFTYHYFPGPNSNTFTAWFLKHFSDIKFRLPWNAFGKTYLD